MNHCRMQQYYLLDHQMTLNHTFAVCVCSRPDRAVCHMDFYVLRFAVRKHDEMKRRPSTVGLFFHFFSSSFNSLSLFLDLDLTNIISTETSLLTSVQFQEKRTLCNANSTCFLVIVDIISFDHPMSFSFIQFYSNS